MKRSNPLLVSVCIFGIAANAAEPVDYALINGQIYTGDVSAPWASSVAVAGQKIAYVGHPDSAGWREIIGPKTKVYDLDKDLVLPSFVDSHAHPGRVALSAWHTILPFTLDVHEQLRFMAEWAAANPEQKVIYAEYYPTQMFGAAGPNKELIDQYLPDRPVIWQDFSDHSSCLNSKALELMGVDRNTPDPEPGTAYFVRDKDGNPTGWVKEHAYAPYLPKLYTALNWWPPATVPVEDLADLLDDLVAHGISAVFDARGTEDTFAALAELERSGRLHLYYHGSIQFSTLEELPARLADLRSWQRKYGDRYVRLTAAKLYLDGTNEVSTSALLAPFATEPDKRGELRMSKEDLITSMTMLNNSEFDLHIHVTGDRAFRVALDAVEEARRRAGSNWRLQVTLAHAELIDDADFGRVAPLGVLVNWTPHWSGGYFQGSQETLGMARYNDMYRFQPIISMGGMMTFGSDTTTLYEWSRSNPFLGIQIAHTRRDTNPNYQYGLRKPASEMLQVRDLLTGYTINGARQLRLDKLLGSIEPGKLANVLVVDRNIFHVPSDEIAETAVNAVLFEGKLVAGSLGRLRATAVNR